MYFSNCMHFYFIINYIICIIWVKGLIQNKKIEFKSLLLTFCFKYIFHPKMKICWKSTQTQNIQDDDDKCSITSLAHQWIQFSECAARPLHLNGCFLQNTAFHFTRHYLMNWRGVRITAMFLSAVWTLILTAPIQCRGSIGKQMINW